ncbi:LysR family transcriptional regulator [Cupriavidus necator]
MKHSSDQLDGFLLRLLVAVMEERSVSRAAGRLNLPQSTVSAGLSRLRNIFEDPLFVRGRNSMVPTERMVSLYDRMRGALEELDGLCVPPAVSGPAEINRTFHLGSLDYVSSRFIPTVIARILRSMPSASVEVHSLTMDFDYLEALENGALDLVVGNWGSPPEHLHLLPLFEDDIVCLMRQGHPVLRRPAFTQADYLACDHLGLLPFNVNQLGVIDAYLAQLGLRRHVKVVLPYFNNVPDLLTQSDLIFTTSRRFAEAHAAALPLTVVPAPLPFPPMRFYLLWHDRTHRSIACRLLREAVAEAITGFHQTHSGSSRAVATAPTIT